MNANKHGNQTSLETCLPTGTEERRGEKGVGWVASDRARHSPAKSSPEDRPAWRESLDVGAHEAKRKLAKRRADKQLAQQTKFRKTASEETETGTREPTQNANKHSRYNTHSQGHILDSE